MAYKLSDGRILWERGDGFRIFLHSYVRSAGRGHIFALLGNVIGSFIVAAASHDYTIHRLITAAQIAGAYQVGLALIASLILYLSK